MEIFKKRALFWDVEADQIDPQKNSQFIIERILNFGDEKDFRWARDFYGEKTLKKAVVASQTLDKKSLFFWCNFFNLNKAECLLQQSAQKQNLFWTK